MDRFDVYNQVTLQLPPNPYLSSTPLATRIHATPAIPPRGRKVGTLAHFDMALVIKHQDNDSSGMSDCLLVVCEIWRLKSHIIHFSIASRTGTSTIQATGVGTLFLLAVIEVLWGPFPVYHSLLILFIVVHLAIHHRFRSASGLLRSPRVSRSLGPLHYPHNSGHSPARLHTLNGSLLCVTRSLSQQTMVNLSSSHMF